MEGQLKLIIKRWGILPFAAAGVALLALLMLVLVALPYARVPSPPTLEPLGDTRFQRYLAPDKPFVLTYPTSWHAEEIVDGVAFWPTLEGAGFAERGAAFYIYTTADESGVGCPVPATLCAELGNHALREAQNVLVGEMSGSETVSELSVANSTASLLDGATQRALTAAQTRHVTLIAWQATWEDTRYHVLMIDARDGASMDLLQAIRDSIRWRTKSVK